MQVENMPTPQLFRRIVHRPRLACRSRFSRDHILPTNDTASPSEPIDLRLCCVRVSRVHVPCCAAILDEVEAFGGERSEGEVEWDDVVDREDAGQDEDCIEERGVYDEFDRVCDEGLVKI